MSIDSINFNHKSNNIDNNKSNVFGDIFEKIKTEVVEMQLDGINNNIDKSKWSFKGTYIGDSNVNKIMEQLYALGYSEEDIKDIVVENAEKKGLKITLNDGNVLYASARKKQNEFTSNWFVIIDNIVLNDSNERIIKKVLDNGSILEYIYTEDGVSVKENGEPLSILGDYAKLTNQFGGNQNLLQEELAKEIIDTNGVVIRYKFDEYAYKLLKDAFPGASDKEYFDLLKLMEKNSCKYTSNINTLFLEFEGREKEFEETFGFPMYTVDEVGNINFNYERLILDYYIAFERYYEPYYDIKSGEKMHGGDEMSQLFFKKYLKERYNIEYNVSERNTVVNDIILWMNNHNGVDPKTGKITKMTKREYIKAFYEKYAAGKNNHMLIGTENFSLYQLDENGNKGDFSEGPITMHSMLVTGVTPEGDFIVSSWGKEYVIDLDDIIDTRIAIAVYGG